MCVCKEFVFQLTQDNTHTHTHKKTNNKKGKRGGRKTDGRLEESCESSARNFKSWTAVENHMHGVILAKVKTSARHLRTFVDVINN